MKLDHTKTPFFTALKAYADSDPVALDVPGHKLGRIDNELMQYVGTKMYQMDSNAPRGLDNLNQPKGVIKEAGILMADAFKAHHAFFLTGGTTMGILAMIMSVVRAKEKLIMPRNVHKSAINGLILSGAVPVFINPDVDEKLGIANHVTFESVKKAIDENLDAKAIFLINPTYFGATSDLRSIATYAHKHDMMVLVDEAHGSHFVFHDMLPYSAMEAGADLSAASIHKTSGSLTQSSVLLATDKVDVLRVKSTINMLQSTSPSSLLLASLDVARKEMYFNAKKQLDDAIRLGDETRIRLNQIPGIKVYDASYFEKRGSSGFDHTKLVIDVSNLGMSGFQAYRVLKDHYNIQLELAETNIILALLSIGSNQKDMDRLISALIDLSSKYYDDTIEKKPIRMLKKTKAELFIRPREAYHAPKKYVRLEDSEDEIAAESIMIYPPGIPIVIPGERITQDVLDDLAFYQQSESVILGDSEEGFVKIIDKEAWSKWEDLYEDE